MTITGKELDARNGGMEKAVAERGKAVSAAILAIEKQFGAGSIMKLGSAQRQQVDSIPTGSIALDLALGVGGIPRGRITEIFGPESSGKTTVCQHVIAEAQRRGGIAAFIDVEHALDPGYARACGVNVDELLVSQPDTGEQALEITETLIRSGGVDIVVLDSVAALVPRAEIEGEMGDSFVGIQARLMSQALRKLTGRGQPVEHVPRVHQPAAREDRRDVRQPRDDARRSRAQVLRVGPPRHPARRDDQDRHRVGRQPGPRQGREEQGVAAVPRRRVRRHVRRGHQHARAACSTSAWRWTSSRRPAPGSRSARRVSARVARHPRSSSRGTPTSPRRSTAGSAAKIDRGRPPGRGHRRGRVGDTGVNAAMTRGPGDPIAAQARPAQGGDKHSERAHLMVRERARAGANAAMTRSPACDPIAAQARPAQGGDKHSERAHLMVRERARAGANAAVARIRGDRG